MRWFKLLDANGNLAGAEAQEHTVFIFRRTNGVIDTCAESLAQGIVSADYNSHYQLQGKESLVEEGLLTAVEIYETEYEELYREIPDPEDEEPEIPDDPDGDGKNPMTRAELTEEVAALKKANAMLIGMLLENREVGMKASKAYNEGDLIVVNGELYKVLVKIASGSVLTVGTNVKQTTVAAEIAAVNS